MTPTGSNLTFIDTQAKQGYVYTYHLNRAAAQANFAAMRTNGQTIAKIILYHWAAEENFLADGFVLPLDTWSNLDSQSWKNLRQMITDLVAAGFTRVELVPGPAGNTLGPSNWTSLDNRWEREGNFIVKLRSLIRSCDIDYGILFGGDDFFANSNVVVTAYAQTLWTWYTAGFGNADAYFSVPAVSASIKHLPLIYTGLNFGGPVNWPKLFPIPMYGNGEWRSVYGDTTGVLNALDLVGAPANLPWCGSEGYSFLDQTGAVQAVRAVQDAVRPCAGLCQWGILRDPSGKTIDHNANPTVAGIPAGLWS